MNIITRKKEILEVINKLNEATALATKALNDLSEYVDNTQPMKVPNTILVKGVEYVETDKEPASGDYVVLHQVVHNRIKKDTPYLCVGDNTIRVGNDDYLWLGAWVAQYELEYTVFTKKPRTRTHTRKDIINKAVDYIDGYLYKYVTFDTYECKMHITHNYEDRTSTIVLKGKFSGTIRHKETIRCHPDDVYNNAIGAAILIARVKGDKEIVELFENAPQPTEIKSGMVIDILCGDILLYLSDFIVESYNKTSDTVRGRRRGSIAPRHIGGVKQDGFKIKDDSNAIY